MGLFETLGTNLGNIYAAKKNREETARNARRNSLMVESMDWTPTYANNLMSNGGQYQKTESPLADSYLESILTGSNPDTVFSGSPNAAGAKQAKLAQREQQFGKPADLLARQRKVQSTNPYQTWTPDDPRYAASVAASTGQPAPGQATPAGMNDLGAAVGSAHTPGGGYEQDFQSHYPTLAKVGIDAATHKKLLDAGVLQDWQQRDATDFAGYNPKQSDQFHEWIKGRYAQIVALTNEGKIQEAKDLEQSLRLYQGAGKNNGKVA